MAGLKFKVHPLLIAFGIYFALLGKVFSFLVYTLSAVIHELGHYFQSEKLGYGLKKIILMPYGALITGDIENVKYVDEIKIALAGPIVNLTVALFCVALWWLIPDLYPYTDLIVTANISLAIINLLPCYPLDGGRVLLATLSLLFKRSKAKKVVKILGVVLGAVLFALFVYSLFVSPNFTLLFFSVFMLIGATSTTKEADYIKVFTKISNSALKRPVSVKKIAVPSTATIKSLFSLASGDCYYELIIIDGDNKKTIEGEKVYELLTEQSPYSTLKEVLFK